MHYSIKTILLLPLLAAATIACSAHTSNQCRITTTPTVIVDRPGRVLMYWDEPNVAGLWEPLASPSASLSTFRQEIQKVMNSDVRAIFQKQLPLELGPEDRENIDMALNGDAGVIRPINCFESLMLERQLVRKPMITEPTEFLAMVLSKDSMLRIYYFSVDKPGIGNVSEINQIVDQAVAAGYRLEFGLHNHNFFVTDNNVRGGVAPSANDVKAFRAQLETSGMEKALITNGFDTLVIDKTEFYRFKAVE